ncbi:methyltetrahydrofolate cobalamin methyltransferase [Sporomusa sphaeroides]|jgi:5-methyltetrahydrofolate corrinoid/iron sulfur protein methyltransferase|uniref:5-methyltetrahydrofolate:corrinoid/iron-sulfur protein co-methyltransferase n=2 Tax=Sporomusa TaxID=2375 RepID=A0ABP2C6V1_9FIRM|nr:methyltetrahydrofolate cobalamin methyltransferase [Sporomusa sphaeroides]MCM0758934.1 methyltetrahydrofolate cobalamin methyltransferase [Sporomusa sphaeroides DSM 2875]OLS55010.1 5-methyltetrahydrofolate:corrinoid/iron-sulfur protein co-methyltransferase [Sporomusa sphaeroides DSM 2875]CVK19456.1 5-methyltetrahydrofolate:corrinoid/iron-sulfur protein co-methyltransferase [Sporomusa sphaeroides DSM 2875]
MIIVGERINTSRKGLEPAVKSRDAAFIQAEAESQLKAGSTYIDVNCGTLLGDEPEALSWLVRTVQEKTDAALCIDSPNPAALAAALKFHKGKALINSISGESGRYEPVVSLIQEYKASVVALAMDDAGMPSTVKDRLAAADRLITRLTKDGVAVEDIYIDPLIQPISTDGTQAMAVFETISTIMKAYPGIHTICGLSNVSFGLPGRGLLNRSFVIMCITAGLDAVICDPLNTEMIKAIYAAEALSGRDEFCMEYIDAFRAGRLA